MAASKKESSTSKQNNELAEVLFQKYVKSTIRTLGNYAVSNPVFLRYSRTRREAVIANNRRNGKICRNMG